MQTRDMNDNTLESMLFSEGPKDFRKALRPIPAWMEKEDVSHVVVGKIPAEGSIVRINGLDYSVVSSENKKITLELV